MKYSGLLLLLYAVCATAASSSAPWPDDATLRQRLLIHADTRLSFRGLDGAPIDEATFLAAANTGDGIAYKGEAGTGFVVLTLSKPITKPRFVLSDMAIGEPIPAFTLTTLDGHKVNSRALPDRLTVVEFFFVDCSGCIAEVPALNAFRAAHPEVGTLALTFDARREVDVFQKVHGLTWPIVADAVAFFSKANVQVYPSIGLVDGHGKLLALEQGWKLHPKGKELSGNDIARWVAEVR